MVKEQYYKEMFEEAERRKRAMMALNCENTDEDELCNPLEKYSTRQLKAELKRRKEMKR